MPKLLSVKIHLFMKLTSNLIVLATVLAIAPASIQAKTVKDKKQVVVGFVAQLICKAQKYDYSEEQMQERMQIFVDMQGKEYLPYIQDQKVIKAGALMSQSMSPNCNKIISEGEAWKKTMDYMDKNGL